MINAELFEEIKSSIKDRVLIDSEENVLLGTDKTFKIPNGTLKEFNGAGETSYELTFKNHKFNLSWLSLGLEGELYDVLLRSI